MSGKHFQIFVLAALALMLVFAFGCSDDDSNPTTSGSAWSEANFADFDQLVEEIAPALYTPPAAAPGDWTTGEVPLLGKVVGDEEPMALYTNLDQFAMVVSELENYILMNDEGVFMLDTTASLGDTNVTDFVTFSELTGATAVPTAMQDLLGTSLELDYLVDMTWSDMGDNDITQVAFRANDSVQTMFLYDIRAENDSVTCSSVYYGSLDMVDSSIVMKGMTYKSYGNDHNARWVYNINSVDESEFEYQMSWYSNESGDFTLLGCIIGGGDASDEFALKYRVYNPADSVDYVHDQSLEQVFNADYSAGSSLITAYSDYVNENLFMLYAEMPTALLVSPWAITQ